LNQLVDFHKIQQAGHTIEEDLNAISFNHFKMVEVKISEVVQ
jgi:hypothetical protein